MRNPEILEKLKEQFILVSIDLYGNNEAEDEITVLCYSNEHSEEEIEALFVEYDKGYEEERILGAFEDYLVKKGINFWILNKN